MNTLKPLNGKRALVTGAGKGIGRGVALALAEAGASIVAHYRSNPTEAETLVAELSNSGVEAWSFSADLADSSQLNAMFDAIESRWGGLDIAVNNAGWDPGQVSLEDIDDELYQKLTNVNIKGTLFCCLREIALMEKNKTGGSVINVGSVQQETSVPGRTLYAMSKGAIHALTGQLALESGPKRIRVNNIAPGYIEVERMSNKPDFNRTAIAADIPIGRIGDVKDVGDFAVFLASDNAEFITGQTLIIDGGVSRKLARSSRIDK